MWRRLIQGVCTRPGGLLLIGTAIGILAGAERLFWHRHRVTPTVVPSPSTPVTRPQIPSRRENYFQIRRTKSELGYTYWYLQGYGCYQCFLLFDTWREAVESAAIRLRPLQPRSPTEAETELNAQYC
jgi:hypothetical protein